MRRGDEHLERVLALAYRNLERLTALGSATATVTWASF
jgi:hypothetical protein